MTYVKLFGSILDSTVWNEPGPTRLVWITMLAMADQHGCVWASVPGLAKRAGVTREECERALECFLAPDPDSRTRDFEGRRIETIDGGWLLLNHGKFRDMLSIEDRKEKAAQRQRKYKERRAESNASLTVADVQSQTLTPVTTSDQIRSDQIKSSTPPSEVSGESPPAPEQRSFKLAPTEQAMSKKSPAPDMADAVTHFKRRWVEVRQPDDGVPPTLTKADRFQLVSMLGKYGLEDWKQHLERYLFDDDRHLAANGYPLRMMPQRVDGYRATRTGTSHVGHAKPAPHNTETREHEL